MNLTRSRAFVFLLFAIVLISTSVLAQQHPNLERGFAADRIYNFGALDDVSMLNLNLILSIPMGQAYPVSTNFSYNMALAYNSKLWDYEPFVDPASPDSTKIEAVANQKSNAGFGWQLSMGGLSGPGSEDTANPWMYDAPQGSEHRFYRTLHPGQVAVSNVFYTRDSSYLRLRITQPSVSAELDSPDGVTREFEYRGNNEWRLLRIRDQFKDETGNHTNFVNFSYEVSSPRCTGESSAWLVTDAHGRQTDVCFSDFSYNDTVVPMVTEIVQPAFDDPNTAGADVSRHTFTYIAREITRGCNVETTKLSPTLILPLLEQVTLPDGSMYIMRYTQTSTATGSCSQGSIVQLTLPTRGTIEWEYSGIKMPVWKECNNSFDYAHAANAVFKKRHLDTSGALLGEWMYETQLSPKPAMESFICENNNWVSSEPQEEEMANSVTLPTKDKIVHYFSVWPGPGEGEGHDPSGDSINGFKMAEYTLPFTRFSSTISDGKFLSQELFDCDEGTGTCPSEPVRRTYVTFERDEGLFDGGTDWTHENWRRSSTKTLFLDDGGRHQTSESSDFDGFGNYRRTLLTSDFKAGDERETITDFNAGSNALGQGSSGNGSLFISTGASWITGLYSRQSTIENINEIDEAAVADSCFDTTTGALNGNRIYRNKGSITIDSSVSPSRRVVTPAASANDVVTLFTRDFMSDGILISRGDVQIQDRFGGDHTPLMSDDICQPRSGSEYRMTHQYVAGSLATSQWNGVSWKSVDNSIDPSTGRVRLTRDPAGIETTFNYDAAGRLRSVRPAPGHGAWTTYSYSNATATTPASVSVDESTNGLTTGDLRRSSVEFDSFGRVVKEKRFIPTIANPGGEAVSRVTRYNALGWKTAVSEQQAGEPSTFTTWSEFDAFGRARRISPPSSVAGHHDVTMEYRGTREVRKTTQIATFDDGITKPSTTIEQYDARGRLVRVIEPLSCRTFTSPCPEADLTPVTEYSYDVFGNLSRVCADPSNGVCTQLRLFTYDGRGFLASERTPERGVNGNATTEYSLYDSRGNAGRKLTGTSGAQFDLRTSYDSIGRPVRLSSHGGARLVKEWTHDFDAATGIGHNAALIRSVRRNNDPVFGTDVVVSEIYQYGGIGGRVSRKDTTVTHDADSRNFVQTFQWTDLGSSRDMHYPFISGTPAFEVASDYTQGILTAVRNKNGGDFAPSIRYHANGLLHQVSHANAMSETIESDASGMARPRSIGVTGGSSWSSGEYAYDGAGNISKIGATSYSYDAVSRLRGWRETNPNGFSEQYLGYDVFGNKYDGGFQRCGSDPSSGLGFCVGTSVAIPTIHSDSNHFAEMTYDANGNVVNHGTYTYAYDGTDMMTGMSTGSRDFRYAYTADDERIGTYDIATQRWTWKLRDLDGKPLRELASSGGTLGFANWTWSKDFIYRGSSILASITPTETQHFHLDHVGTPRLITAAGGVQRGRHDYAPFGAETTSSLQNDQRLKFTAHERDMNGPATSEDRDYLDYMHARYYNPNLGRFLSVDAGPAKLRRPQTWNRFAYVHNNPLKYVDPDGHAAVAAAAPAIGLGLGVVTTHVILMNTNRAYREAATSAVVESLVRLNELLSSLNEIADAVDGEIVIDGTRHPEAAQHVEDAQSAGKPEILTISRPGADKRRREALQGTKPEKGRDRDEYPPASTAEGGTGASVRPIGSADNRGSGGSMGQQMKRFHDGAKVRYRVVWDKVVKVIGSK